MTLCIVIVYQPHDSISEAQGYIAETKLVKRDILVITKKCRNKRTYIIGEPGGQIGSNEALMIVLSTSPSLNFRLYMSTIFYN